jgi:signal transduction histidine kinase
LTGLTPSEKHDWIAGGGDMGALVRSLDWSQTQLGPLQAWPQSLRTTVSTCLSSRFPILIWWGPDLVMIYNDALSRIIGNKHPRAMGQRGAEGWWEVWHVLGPMLMSVLSEGASTWSENQRLDIERTLQSGYLEETYFTFSYSPIRDESGGIGGVFCAVTETTAQVLGERRLRTLSALAQQTAEVTTAREACLKAAGALEDNAADMPAAFVYLTEREKSPTLAAMAGVTCTSAGLPDSTRAEWLLDSVLATGMPALVDEAGVQRSFDAMGCESALPVASALVLPLGPVGKPGAMGVLVIGLAPLLLLDEKYRSFLMLVAGHIGTAIASARALEAAEQRADALAQIDRAKTAFFSNVSHEFRTPLTLMLGPTEDALGSPSRSLSGPALETVHRNGVRLLRLVNTLLDFSRIEAGRADANFEPTDLPALTRDFAAAFRLTIERAGLGFEVDCEPFVEPTWVDRDMWEKIVLNLLSNALKFTFVGAIHVMLRIQCGVATLTVRDSGVGISAVELPRVFERFHRIEGVRSRSFEGTGIGLAFVHDLVKLHGGTVSVESTEDVGSTFTIVIPTGNAHLPVDRIRTSVTPQAEDVRDPSFVLDASGWLPVAPSHTTPVQQVVDTDETQSTTHHSARILLVDDNADMRDYLGRLLREHWQVDMAGDGVEALAVARHHVPSLVLTDVMMPNLDGFGLLRALRADARTRSVPVLMLSARAGEDSRIEGLAVGADDYLIKPFSAKELIARVTTHLELGQLRQTAEASRNRLHSLFEQAPAAIAVLHGPTFLFEFANLHYKQLVQRHELVGKTIAEVWPEFEGQAVQATLRKVFTTGKRFVGQDFLVTLKRAADQLEEVYFDLVYDPFRLNGGPVEGIMVVAFEVTERVRSAHERERLLAEREGIYAEREGLLVREREARADAERASLAKDEFLAMLGHELRNPLAPIVTALHLLRRRGTDESGQEYAIIDRQVKHLTTLVDDLLDVSAITRGKIALKREHIELSLLLDRAIEMASPLINQRFHALTVTVARQGLIVDVDATRLAQVMSNLLTNAAKYTEPGGRITVSARSLDDRVELAVADTGIGISAEMLPHVFELFVQERQAIDRARGGLGLGLAIVHNLMTMHDGSVIATSDGRGHGSTFTIDLPRVAQVDSRLESVGVLSSSAMQANGYKVLIVDDNVDAADTMARFLAELGFDVRVAYDGPTAVALVQSYTPRVAFLDIGLPIMDGYELARQLRRHPDTLTTYLVALTGYGQKGDIEDALKAGFDAHFVKPISLERLEALLKLRQIIDL